MNEEEKEFFETRIPILRRYYELVSCFNGQVNEEETKKLFTYISQLRKENRKLQQERNNYKELYEKEKGKVETYENPEDLTLFYMWLDEKAKDKMKRLIDNWNKLKEGIEKDIKEYEESEFHIKEPPLTIQTKIDLLLKMEDLERL